MQWHLTMFIQYTIGNEIFSVIGKFFVAVVFFTDKRGMGRMHYAREGMALCFFRG